jgi:hypothetical protein
MRHTSLTTRLTVSITCFITLTALLHVVSAIASSARSGEYDIPVWLAATVPTDAEVPHSMRVSSVLDKSDIGAVTVVICEVSVSDWTIEGLSTPRFGALTVAVREELALDDTVIVKIVASSFVCLEGSSALPKTIPSSTCRVLSQIHE